MAAEFSAILDCRLVRVPDAESTVSAASCYEMAGWRECNGPYAERSWSADESQGFRCGSLVRPPGRGIIISLCLEGGEQSRKTVFGNAIASWIGSHSGVVVIFGAYRGRRWAARRLIAILLSLHSCHGSSSRDIPED